jgi:hypothetical protein
MLWRLERDARKELERQEQVSRQGLRGHYRDDREMYQLLERQRLRRERSFSRHLHRLNSACNDLDQPLVSPWSPPHLTDPYTSSQ